MNIVAVVWTFWLAVPIAAGAILTTLALARSYFVKIIKPQYPPRSARKG